MNGSGLYGQSLIKITAEDGQLIGVSYFMSTAERQVLKNSAGEFEKIIETITNYHDRDGSGELGDNPSDEVFIRKQMFTPNKFLSEKSLDGSIVLTTTTSIITNNTEEIIEQRVEFADNQQIDFKHEKKYDFANADSANKEEHNKAKTILKHANEEYQKLLLFTSEVK